MNEAASAGGRLRSLPGGVVWPTMISRFLRLLALGMLLLPASLPGQTYQGRELVQASLVSEVSAFVPGEPFRVGVLLRMAPGWHTYWEFPGDSGLPTRVTWKLPEGFRAGPLQWPLPRKVLEPGDIEVLAYKEEVLLFAEITPPSDWVGEARLEAVLSWLVCEQICIPGSATVSLNLPASAASSSPSEAAGLFQRFSALVPSTAPPPWSLSWQQSPEGWALRVTDVSGAGLLDFLPLPAEDQTVGRVLPVVVENGTATLQIPLTSGREAPLRGVLVAGDGADRRGWNVSSALAAAATPPLAAPAPPSAAGGGLWSFLLFGFLGGFILNLMPCVLPVISLKIFGFLRQAGDSRRSILAHGLAFVAGIFVWFLGLAALIVLLKSAGHEVTWAFQFQNPWFNFAIGALVFVFALNLFGVFEITLPGRAVAGLAEASGHGGMVGSFLQGIFATLLATPCTAPFLGSALGFAFSQSSLVIFAMFASIAAGMGFPYLLLSAQPGWMRFLPKPGAWMERLKQFMGFPLLATLLWLLYVVGQQRGTGALIWAAAFYLSLGFAAWLYGAFTGPLAQPRTRLLGLLGVVLTLLLGGWWLVAGRFAAEVRSGAGAPSMAAESGGIAWVPFSEEALQRELAAGKPVFLDFTADWCITCKFNERTAIDTPAVREALRQGGIVAMKADWTSANPEITRKLASFGRVGVPFYLYYPAGKAAAPVELPELLTEAIVLRALAAE